MTDQPNTADLSGDNASQPSLGVLDYTLRQMADQLEQLIKVTVAAEGRLRAKHQLADETTVKKIVANDRQVRLLRATKEMLRAELIGMAHQHPVYMWAMGVPGISFLLVCKLVGLMRMDGPNCDACGAESEIIRNKILCWRCHNVPEQPESGPRIKVGDKCQNKPDGKKKCGHVLTQSAFAMRCPECGHLQHDFPNFSQLRTFCGHTPGRNRLIAKQASPFSSRLRVYCYQAFDSMLKAYGTIKKQREKGKIKASLPEQNYAEIYEKWRAKYAEREGCGSAGVTWLKNRGIYTPERFPKYKHRVEAKKRDDAADNARPRLLPEWPDARQHFASKNKMMDVFLYHLWYVWRTECGWPTRPPYPIEHLGHHMEYDLNAFSSRALAEEKHEKALKEVGAIERMVDRLLQDYGDGSDDAATAGDSANDAEL